MDAIFHPFPKTIVETLELEKLHPMTLSRSNYISMYKLTNSMLNLRYRQFLIIIPAYALRRKRFQNDIFFIVTLHFPRFENDTYSLKEPYYNISGFISTSAYTKTWTWWMIYDLNVVLGYFVRWLACIHLTGICVSCHARVKCIMGCQDWIR